MQSRWCPLSEGLWARSGQSRCFGGVGLTLRRKTSGNGSGMTRRQTLYVTGFSSDVRAKDLAHKFEKFGRLVWGVKGGAEAAGLRLSSRRGERGSAEGSGRRSHRRRRGGLMTVRTQLTDEDAAVRGGGTGRTAGAGAGATATAGAGRGAEAGAGRGAGADTAGTGGTGGATTAGAGHGAVRGDGRGGTVRAGAGAGAGLEAGLEVGLEAEAGAGHGAAVAAGAGAEAARGAGRGAGGAGGRLGARRSTGRR
ncbi:hypothetical protein PMAC_003044 [Pneumocystis sp. 'macacae']|nr:hypothetical protein PMAC_003044 [Pneumocystis sp. 'macacae']